MEYFPMILWMVFVVVVACLVGVVVASDGARVVGPGRRERGGKRRLWVGAGLDRAALARVRAAGRAGAERPITSAAEGRAARLRERLDALHRLHRQHNRLYETRMKNIGLTRQQEEAQHE